MVINQKYSSNCKFFGKISISTYLDGFRRRMGDHQKSIPFFTNMIDFRFSFLTNWFHWLQKKYGVCTLSTIGNVSYYSLERFVGFGTKFTRLTLEFFHSIRWLQLLQELFQAKFLGQIKLLAQAIALGFNTTHWEVELISYLFGSHIHLQQSAESGFW